jgi:tetratricopeptide (TPR) repeat protein
MRPYYCLIFILVGCIAAVSAIRFQTTGSSMVQQIKPNRSHQTSQVDSLWAAALVPQKGDKTIDRDIRQLQQQVKLNRRAPGAMTRLGWAFVAKARLSFDPGYYKLAESCALWVRSENSDDADALLLQGHILQSLHRFKDAEPIAQRLTAVRHEASDYALLGDLLMEQGRLSEALPPYQRMIDLRPDLQSYTRVAHMRWLKGDLAGAIEVMRMAVTSGSPEDAEPTAWAYTRLGIYELQAGQSALAARCARMATQFAPDYPPALLLAGRILLAQGEPGEAVRLLQVAASETRLPEYEWILADALRESGDRTAAQQVEGTMKLRGASTDPRTFALYLATRGEDTGEALKLARSEMEARVDVLTMDAISWCALANGHSLEAADYSKRALSEGTQDARLYYHAGCIALAADHYLEAQRLFALSGQIKQMLFPSERDDLEKRFEVLRKASTPSPTSNQP